MYEMEGKRGGGRGGETGETGRGKQQEKEAGRRGMQAGEGDMQAGNILYRKIKGNLVQKQEVI